MDYPHTSTDTAQDREVRQTLRGLDDLLPDMLYLLPKCDEEITMRKALCETAQQFCRQTGAFVYTSVIDMVNDTTRYAITFPWPADIIVVNEVRRYNVQSGVETLESTLLPQTQWYVEDPDDEDNVYLNLWTPINSNSGTTYRLKADVALMPYFDEMIGTSAYALPEKFMRRWRGALVAGAVAFLSGLSNKAWSDPQLADMQRRRYDEMRSEAVCKAQITNMKRGGATCMNPLPWC